MTFHPRSPLLLALSLSFLLNFAHSDPTWKTISTSPGYIGREEAAFARCSPTKLCLLGGRGRSPVSILDTESLSYSEGSLPPVELHHFQAFQGPDNCAWVVGAWTGPFPAEDSVPEIWTYCADTDQWSTGPDIARPRGSGAAFLWNDAVYLLGGNVGGHNIDATLVPWFDRYDIATRTWHELPDLPNPRDHFHAVIRRGKVYVAGGRDSTEDFSVFFNDVESAVDVFDLATNTWSSLPDFPRPRGGTFSALHDGKVFVMGGEGFGRAWSEVDILEGDTFVPGPDMPSRRHGAAAVSCNGVLWVAGGVPVQAGGAPNPATEAYFDGDDPNPCTPPRTDPPTETSTTAEEEPATTTATTAPTATVSTTATGTSPTTTATGDNSTTATTTAETETGSTSVPSTNATTAGTSENSTPFASDLIEQGATPTPMPQQTISGPGVSTQFPTTSGAGSFTSIVTSVPTVTVSDAAIDALSGAAEEEEPLQTTAVTAGLSESPLIALPVRTPMLGMVSPSLFAEAVTPSLGTTPSATAALGLASVEEDLTSVESSLAPSATASPATESAAVHSTETNNTEDDSDSSAEDASPSAEATSEVESSQGSPSASIAATPAPTKVGPTITPTPIVTSSANVESRPSDSAEPSVSNVVSDNVSDLNENTGDPEPTSDTSSNAVGTNEEGEENPDGSPENGAPDPVCFSSDNTVQLRDGRTKFMHELRIGDFVKVSHPDKYSPVYFFSHHHRDVTSKAVRISTGVENVSLEVSPSHLLYVNGVLAPASTVRVGDKLEVSKENHINAAVTAVEIVRGTGLHNPHTLHGDIVVSGVVASTFTTAVHPMIARVLLAPFKAAFHLTGPNPFVGEVNHAILRALDRFYWKHTGHHYAAVDM